MTGRLNSSSTCPLSLREDGGPSLPPAQPLSSPRPFAESERVIPSARGARPSPRELRRELPPRPLQLRLLLTLHARAREITEPRTGASSVPLPLPPTEDQGVSETGTRRPQRKGNRTARGPERGAECRGWRRRVCLGVGRSVNKTPGSTGRRRSAALAGQHCISARLSSASDTPTWGRGFRVRGVGPGTRQPPLGTRRPLSPSGGNKSDAAACVPQGPSG